MIINLTQHPATPEQKEQGVWDLTGEPLAALKEALTFTHLPSGDELKDRAEWIAALAADQASAEDREDPAGGFSLMAMIGGAPYLMAPLENALRNQGFNPVYAFSVRESTEHEQPDGTVKKTTVFRHLGFVGQ